MTTSRIYIIKLDLTLKYLIFFITIPHLYDGIEKNYDWIPSFNFHYFGLYFVKHDLKNWHNFIEFSINILAGYKKKKKLLKFFLADFGFII